jgi:hypothetical protein
MQKTPVVSSVTPSQQLAPTLQAHVQPCNCARRKNKPQAFCSRPFLGWHLASVALPTSGSCEGGRLPSHWTRRQRRNYEYEGTKGTNVLVYSTTQMVAMHNSISGRRHSCHPRVTHVSPMMRSLKITVDYVRRLVAKCLGLLLLVHHHLFCRRTGRKLLGEGHKFRRASQVLAQGLRNLDSLSKWLVPASNQSSELDGRA